MDSKEFLKYQMMRDTTLDMTGMIETPDDLTASSQVVELNLKWKVENVRQGVGIFAQMSECERFPDIFQFGLKYENGIAIVSLISINLHRCGIRIALARLSCNKQRLLLMTRKTGERLASKLDWFTQEFNDGLPSKCCFEFHVYVEGVIENYQHQQYDQLLDSQMYACLQSWSDFQFIIDDQVYSAHKFILAARSALLAAEVELRDSMAISDDIDSATFECFLLFLYTGRIVLTKKTIICNKLLVLAEKFGVKTLKDLCDANMEIFLELENFPERFMSAEPKTSGSTISRIDLEPKSESRLKPDLTEIRFAWHIDQLPKPGEYLIKGVVLQQQKVIHVSFRTGSSKEGKQNHAFFIFSKYWPEGGLAVSDIAVLTRTMVAGAPTKTSHRYYANKWGNVTQLNPGMEIFSIELTDTQLQGPLTAKFAIDLSCKGVGNYVFCPRDIIFSSNIWSSVDGQFTDTELIVSNRTFRVHKSILANRSTLFKELLELDGNLSSTRRIVVSDVDATTFEELLYFIYTGSLRVPANNPKLYEAAKKYQIETLRILCENQVKRDEQSLPQDLCCFLQLIH